MQKKRYCKIFFAFIPKYLEISQLFHTFAPKNTNRKNKIEKE